MKSINLLYYFTIVLVILILWYAIQRKVMIVDVDNNSSSLSLKERLNALHLSVGAPIFIRIFKSESILEVWMKKEDQYLLLKSYRICDFSGGLGPKLKEDDRQSVEGFYTVKKSQLNPNSKYHLSFDLGYPNAYDKAHHRTGSHIMVHGGCSSVGCYAMTDPKIEEIYTLVDEALKHGQSYVHVHAFPFRMTAKNMARYSHTQWYSFWSELKRGYDYFEVERLPPLVKVKNGHYIIYEANE